MKWLFLAAAFFLQGCQIGYIVKNGYGQFSLMNQKVPIKDVLENPETPEETKKKLTLSQEASEFSEKELHLDKTENYTSYIALTGEYPVYAVHAAPKWKLEHHLWYFPIVGDIPYKGYFTEQEAKDYEAELKKENLDTYVRGVSAYSTLGWFKDPIFSSMVKYRDHDLVNTIIHETVHATLYIKSSADFNERMAVFLGNKGTEVFYYKKEGAKSKTVDLIRMEIEDDKAFSHFIGAELTALEEWYKNEPPQNEEARQVRLKEVNKNFKTKLLPLLKTDSYKKFEAAELNNARLMMYKTYMQDLSDFEQLYKLVGENFSEFLKCCKKLKSHDNPEEGLKDTLISLEAHKKSNCSDM
jgi:predicted aminopeptidase